MNNYLKCPAYGREVYDKYGEADRIYKIFVYAEDVKNRRQDLKKECNHGEYIINVEEAVETMEFYEV